MKRLLLTFVVLLAMSGGRVLAQTAAASPTPDPRVYTDAAMNFTAPANAILVGRVISFSLDSLNSDLQPVATWVIRPGQEDARTVQLQMESYTGSPSNGKRSSRARRTAPIRAR